ncbi:MAG: methylmalonyl-CoA mutase [Deltaproteobacteria bacterium RBG_16_48_10]|nr:MAG: methylmalonyl-CoA mutase [Deltaproteobacteria bacterium RBG_16_48_10]
MSEEKRALKKDDSKSKGHSIQMTESGLPVKEVYTQKDLPEGREESVDLPGEYPYTRGVYKTMYRGRLWTMRQYAGLGTAMESNERYKFLLAQGQTGLSVALDLPTQMGYDSDDPRVEDEVGRVGVAIDTLRDIEVLFRDIPLDQISTNFTINSTAAIILAMYYALAEKLGISPDQVRGTVQNDMIKEFIARNTYIFPIEPSLKIVTDIIEFCSKKLPHFNPISIAGYHIREAGADAIQELALTLGAGIVYVQEVLGRGIGIDEFASRLSFHLSSGQDLFEEIAKYRAARKMWAEIMRTRFKPSNPSSELLRVFAGGNGITLTANEPLNNIVRATLQCLVGALGGAQAIHVPAYDEAFAIPTEESARIGLRTQQIIAFESGISKTADPLGGSYFVESLTDELKDRAWTFIEEMDKRGGLVTCIKTGYIRKLIHDRAYEKEKQIQSGEKWVVGVNCFASGKSEVIRLLPMEPGILERQKRTLKEIKTQRDNGAVRKSLTALKEAAQRESNIMACIIEAVKAYATVGEITNILREVYGEYKEAATV